MRSNPLGNTKHVCLFQLEYSASAARSGYAKRTRNVAFVCWPQIGTALIYETASAVASRFHLTLSSHIVTLDCHLILSCHQLSSPSVGCCLGGEEKSASRICQRE